MHQSGKTRWSLTAFLVLAALLVSILGFRTVTSALIFMGVVVVILMVFHGAKRQAARRKAT
jgi:hypothetical protein